MPTIVRRAATLRVYRHALPDGSQPKIPWDAALVELRREVDYARPVDEEVAGPAWMTHDGPEYAAGYAVLTWDVVRRRVPASALADIVASWCRTIGAERCPRDIRDALRADLVSRAIPDRRRHAIWIDRHDGTLYVQGLDRARAGAAAECWRRCLLAAGCRVGAAREVLAEVPPEVVGRLASQAGAGLEHRDVAVRLDRRSVTIEDEAGTVAIRQPAQDDDRPTTRALVDVELAVADGRRVVGCRLDLTSDGIAIGAIRLAAGKPPTIEVPADGEGDDLWARVLAITGHWDWLVGLVEAQVPALGSAGDVVAGMLRPWTTAETPQQEIVRAIEQAAAVDGREAPPSAPAARRSEGRTTATGRDLSWIRGGAR